MAMKGAEIIRQGSIETGFSPIDEATESVVEVAAIFEGRSENLRMMTSKTAQIRSKNQKASREATEGFFYYKGT